MEVVMERDRSAEARLMVLEKHVVFNSSLGEKVDHAMSDFKTRLHRIQAVAESLDKAHFDHGNSVDRQIAGLESMVGGVGQQVRRIGEAVSDIEAKIDQLIALSKPPRIEPALD
jgi:hypothetical protein